MKLSNKTDGLEQPRNLPDPYTSPIPLHVPGPLLSYPIPLPLSPEENTTNLMLLPFSYLF